MARNITRVQWSATDLPWGIKFDELTGTFTGAPTDVGEYTVPVRVKTNYGSDAKNVDIVVVHAGEHAGKVCAVGADAERWSNNATPDMYGFRELPIPRCTKLVRIPTGFAAKTLSGDWYIATTRENEFDMFGGYGGDYYTNPQKYPVSGIDNMGGGKVSINTSSLHVYFAYTQSGSLTIHTTLITSAGKYKDSTQESGSGIKLFQDDYMSGFAYVTNGGDIHIQDEDRFIETGQEVTQLSIWRNGQKSETRIYYMTENGELYTIKGTGNPQQLLPEAGRISYIVNLYTPNADLFVITEAGDVYARGYNTNYRLGLPTKDKYYADLTLVGRYDNAKKISGRYLLTEDGSLYHTGKVLSTESVNYKFNRIYPEHNFYDVAYLGYPHDNESETLVVIKED